MPALSPPPDAAPDQTGGKMLKPGTSVLWRSPDVVQLELGSRRIVIENVAPGALGALLGPRPVAVNAGHAAVLDGAARAGAARADGARADGARDGAAQTSPELVELGEGLDALGFLTVREAAESTVPARLLPELLAVDEPDQAQDLLRRRQRSFVAVHGTTRLAVTMASTLAAAGVGRIGLVDSGTVAATDASPGGLLAADEGRRFAAAATSAVRRAAPEATVHVVSATHRADLVVLADTGPVEPAVRTVLHQHGSAHLVVSAAGRGAVIGPLVVPGDTSCLRCADLHRTDRDPLWPLLAVQLVNRSMQRTHAAVSLAVAVAGLAASHALAFLDGQPAGSLGGTVELELPDWRLRRRSWPVHAQCDCRLIAHRVAAKGAE